MSGRCGNPNCFAHEGEGCALGEIPHTACARWRGQDAPEAAAPATETSHVSVPWSGSALGLADLAHLTPRGRHILIGVLGAHDAGKTTLLTGAYLQLLRGQRIGEFHFAGSRTLGAWESLAAHTRFDDPIKGSAFPPHTPRGTQRVPGLLHLALRNQQDEHRDVFFTDAPGEWFTRWAINKQAPEAEGARWTAQHADAFMVFADCERLSGSQCGNARRETRQLIERLSNSALREPVLLIWAKSDCLPDEAVQSAVRTTLNQRIPHAREFSTSVKDLKTLSDALAEVIGRVWYAPVTASVSEPVINAQPFFAYRSHHA